MQSTSKFVSAAVAARLVASEAVNHKYGLSLPLLRIALVAADVPNLANRAKVHAFNQQGLLVDVAQFLVVDSTTAMHSTVDLNGSCAGQFLADGLEHGFLVVLVDEAGQSARVITVHAEDMSSAERSYAVGRYRHMRPTHNQHAAYNFTVGLIGFLGSTEAARLFAPGVASSQVYFRPAFEDEHQEHLSTTSLDELIRFGNKVPTLSQAFQSVARVARHARSGPDAGASKFH